MRVLVTGSRSWDDVDYIFDVLDGVRERYGRGRVILYHGACPTGADRIADTWAVHRGVTVETFPAQWGRFGRVAGPVRNVEMVRAVAAHDRRVCLAFLRGDSAGTLHCISEARRAGIDVAVHDYNTRHLTPSYTARRLTGLS